jgi:hypothetical protein
VGYPASGQLVTTLSPNGWLVSVLTPGVRVPVSGWLVSALPPVAGCGLPVSCEGPRTMCVGHWLAVRSPSHQLVVSAFPLGSAGTVSGSQLVVSWAVPSHPRSVSGSQLVAGWSEPSHRWPVVGSQLVVKALAPVLAGHRPPQCVLVIGLQSDRPPTGGWCQGPS